MRARLSAFFRENGAIMMTVGLVGFFSLLILLYPPPRYRSSPPSVLTPADLQFIADTVRWNVEDAGLRVHSPCPPP